MTARPPPEAVSTPEAAAFDFRTKPGGSNYGDCAGVYWRSESDRSLNGKLVYINDETENFLGFNGSTWVITSLAQKDRIIRDQKKGFKGFHAGGAGEPEEHEWGQYVVLRRSVVEVAPQPLAVVRIQGLIAAPELNGATGTCQHLDTASGRWAVLLESGDVKLLKTDNLLVCALPPAGSEGPPPPSAAEAGEERAPPPAGAEELRPEVAQERGGLRGTRPPSPLAPEPERRAVGAAQKPAALAVEVAAPGAVAEAEAEAPPAAVPGPAAGPRAVAPGLAARLAGGGRSKPEEVDGLRAELEQVREAKRSAAAEEDFKRAKELRARELELEVQLREAEAPPPQAPKAASAPAAKPEKPAEPAGALKALDNKPELSAAVRAEMAGEVARLYEERAELAAQRKRMAEAGQEDGQAEELLRREGEVEERIVAAEAAALAGLAAAVSGLRQELEALEVERQRAWRAEEDERVAELEQRRGRLEAKLRRLQVAAERAAAAAETAPPHATAPGRPPSGAGVGAGASARAGVGGSSLMRKLQQRRPAAAPATCASCGATAEPRASPDGLGYCSWCWAWWDSQRPAEEVAAVVPFEAPVGDQNTGAKVGARCFWDERDVMSNASGQGLLRPKAMPLIARGASATGGGMRLLVAANALSGSIITEEEAANLHSELPREGEEEEG